MEQMEIKLYTELAVKDKAKNTNVNMPLYPIDHGQ